MSSKKQIKIGIIAIGNELLNGNTVNSNVTQISQLLFEQGYRTAWHKALPDLDSALKAGLKQSLKEADLLLLTGGLGPTHDDRTRAIVADLFEKKLSVDQTLLAKLKERYANAPAALENQAQVIEGAQYLSNPLGTAPVQQLQIADQTLFLLPGVPKEMLYLMRTAVIPALKKIYPRNTEHQVIKLNFFDLSEGKIQATMDQLAQTYPNVQIGIYPNLSLITIVLIADLAFKKAFMSVKAYLMQTYASHFFGEGNIKLAEHVLNLISETKIRFFIQEYFTAGLLTTQLSLAKIHSPCLLGSVIGLPIPSDIQHLDNICIVSVGALKKESVQLSITMPHKDKHTKRLAIKNDFETTRIRVMHQMLGFILTTLKYLAIK